MLRFEPWVIAVVAAISLFGIVFTIPNFLDEDTAEGLPNWLPSSQINLGLDLQGGSHLLLEVDFDAVLVERMENRVDDIRVALRGERIGYTGLRRSGDRVTLQLRDLEQLDRARELIEDIDDGAEVTISDDGLVTYRLTESAVAQLKQDVLAQMIEVLSRRVDETGTREPTIQRQGDDRILVQLPGVEDPEALKRILGKTAKMNFRMVDESVSIEDVVARRVPSGTEVLPESTRTYANGDPVLVPVRKRVVVGGEHLTDAQSTFQDNQPVVSIRFDSTGARKFGDMTTKNVGKRFAIVLDGEVLSAPVVREPIPGGNGVISGSFTIQSANELALLLRSGALPAPLIILEERTVGPSLGADSIAAGKVASIVGMVLVVVYMMMSYGLFGVVSVLALIGNLALIVALLSVLQATLTLPGIAGIVLTIGMAVDANVLIFERIREEVRNGRSPFSSVDIGFRQALRAIIDANVTTMIAAVLLYHFGSGPVRGFAVTLAIGIMTSMFTAIMVTRLLIVLWLQRKRPDALPI